MTAVATGSMDRPRYRPRCARAQPRSRSEGKQQRGGPVTKPTPTAAPETLSLVSATDSPADDRGQVTVVGSAGGSRGHVTATVAAEKKARPRPASGPMDGVSYLPRCARQTLHHLSEGRQQRGGPVTTPTPPEAPEAVSVLSATGSPVDGRGPVIAVGSSDGSRDHVTATSAAKKEARPRTAGDHNRA